MFSLGSPLHPVSTSLQTFSSLLPSNWSPPWVFCFTLSYCFCFLSSSFPFWPYLYQPPFELAFYTLLLFAPFTLHCLPLYPLLWPFFIFIYSLPLFFFPFLISHTSIHIRFARFLPLSTFSSFDSFLILKMLASCLDENAFKKADLPSFLVFSCSVISPLTSFYTAFFFFLGFSRHDQTAWLHQLYGQSMLWRLTRPAHPSSGNENVPVFVWVTTDMMLFNNTTRLDNVYVYFSLVVSVLHWVCMWLPVRVQCFHQFRQRLMESSFKSSWCTSGKEREWERAGDIKMKKERQWQLTDTGH